MKIRSLLTMLMVTVLVFGSAGYILYISFTAPDSNVHVVEQLAGEVMEATSLSAKEGIGLAPTPTPAPAVAGTQAQVCDPNAEFMKTQISVVNYLKQNGFATSFSARVKIAQDYGISNYKGNASDNLLLIKEIQKDFATKNNCTLAN